MVPDALRIIGIWTVFIWCIMLWAYHGSKPWPANDPEKQQLRMVLIVFGWCPVLLIAAIIGRAVELGIFR